MRTALRELLRRPGRFLPVGVALTLLVVLLVVLGGFLDGLELSQTGSYRAQGQRLWVLDEGAERQLGRSRLGPGVRDVVAGVDGVAGVGSLSSTVTTASRAGTGELADVVVLGYELGTSVLPAAPADGAAVVDARYDDVASVAAGDTLQIGPEAVPVEVVELVGDVSEGAPTVWLNPADYRRIAVSANPAGALPAGATQALLVEVADGVDPTRVAEQIDEATGTTDTATTDEVVGALEVVTQQSATFAGIIAVTYVVSLLVVVLFFVLLTLERTRLYAVLKALGGQSRDLLAGLAVQALGIALGAVVAGGLLAVLVVALVPADLPLQIEPVRLGQIAGGTLVTALLGSLLTLRRILRIDPAQAIG